MTFTQHDFLFDTEGGGDPKNLCAATEWKYSTSKKTRKFLGANCIILHRKHDIFIEQLNSNVSGYGKILLSYVLDHLDKYYPRCPIRLFDVSKIRLEDGLISLSTITILTTGKFSWYSQFGFKPCDINSNGPDDTYLDIYYQEYYDKYSKIIASLTRTDAIIMMNAHTHTYPWLSIIVTCLEESSLDLMVDAIASSLDYNDFIIYGENIMCSLEAVFGFEDYDVKWVRRI